MMLPITGTEIADRLAAKEAELRDTMPDFDAKLALYHGIGDEPVFDWIRREFAGEPSLTHSRPLFRQTAPR